MRYRVGIVAAALLATVPVACWALLYDNRPGPGLLIFGGYSERRFLFCLFISWAAAISAFAALGISRSSWLKIISVHIGLLVPIALLELAAFFELVDYRELFMNDGRTYLSATKRDPRRMSGMRPNLHRSGTWAGDLSRIIGAPKIPERYTFETDAFGFRNSHDKSDARVIFLGDSILMGGGLVMEQIVTEHLESEYGLPVFNISVVGTGAQEQLAALERLDLDLNCKLVVQFVFQGNDIIDSKVWRSWVAGGSHQYPRSGLVRTLLEFLNAPRNSGKPDAVKRWSGQFAQSEGETTDVYFLYDSRYSLTGLDKEFEFLSPYLKKSYEGMRNDGATVAMVLVPSKLTAMGPYMFWPAGAVKSDPALWSNALAGKLRMFSRENGIPFLDLTIAFRKAAQQGQLLYFPTDTHLNASGHERMASLVAPFVRGIQLPDGCAPITSGDK